MKISSSEGVRSSTIRAPIRETLTRISSIDPLQTADHSRPVPCQPSALGTDGGSACGSGKRIVNLLRLFNFRHGMRPQDERPSKRYGSVPVDGPAKGRDVMEHWPVMLRDYYRLMCWDEQTGKPLPETLTKLGLGELANDL